MIRKTLLGLLITTTLIQTGYGRLFFVGSNPHLSKIAFPQDILLINYSFISYSLGYQPLPFWGDIDDPTAKPNNSYTATEFNISYSIPGRPGGESSFTFTGSSDIFKHNITYHHIWTPNLKTMFSLKFNHMHMRSNANGLLPAETGESQYEYVQFDYDLARDAYFIYFETIFSYRAGNIPLGLKLGFGYEIYGEPESNLSANGHGLHIESDRILWGWSTTGCNHIFGYRHIGGDAWFKSTYTTGHLYQFDIQLGTTFARAKVGIRYRLRTGIKNNYRWHSTVETGDEPSPEEQFIANFSGYYEQDQWANKSNEHIGRIYANITLIKSKMANINTLFFFGIDHYESKNVNADDFEVSNNVKEKFLNFIVEANPNVNIFLGRRVTIDFGILLEYSWTEYKNTYLRWNRYRGGNEEVCWNTSVHIGDEPSWENFSYADEQFFDFAWELNFQAPLYKDDKHLAAFTVMIINNFKFTNNTKYFGSNIDSGIDSDFVVANKRITDKREIWFNTSISLFYKYEKTFFRLTYIQPLIYSLQSITRVTDGGGNTLYEKKTTMQTSIFESGSVSPQPAQFSGNIVTFMVGYEL